MRSQSLFVLLMTIVLLGWVAPVLSEESASESEPTGEIVIQSQGDGIVEEKRVNGRLYAIRVTPKKGAPYYLVDSDGDGNLETRKNDTDSDLLIPAWVIKEW